VATHTPLIRRSSIPKIASSDIGDPEMKRMNPCAPAMPFAPLGSLLDLMHATRPRISEVYVPALIGHGRRDHTVPFACLDELERGLRAAGTPVERLVLERSCHVVTLDVERDALFRAVGDFIIQHNREG
jgi:carboxylesterase